MSLSEDFQSLISASSVTDDDEDDDDDDVIINKKLPPPPPKPGNLQDGDIDGDIDDIGEDVEGRRRRRFPHGEIFAPHFLGFSGCPRDVSTSGRHFLGGGNGGGNGGLLGSIVDIIGNNYYGKQTKKTARIYKSHNQRIKSTASFNTLNKVQKSTTEPPMTTTTTTTTSANDDNKDDKKQRVLFSN